jgi:secreted trypsin-like serine protease
MRKAKPGGRQAGITSFGESTCAAPGYYGVYTRVDRFNDFISQTICAPDAIPATPDLKITTNGTQVTAVWTPSNNATGYRLFYAPYPAMNPIGSLRSTASDAFIG